VGEARPSRPPQRGGWDSDDRSQLEASPGLAPTLGELIGVRMDRLLTIEQAAELLNVKPRWVRRAIFEKRLGHVKVGRLVRIAESELQRVTKDGERPPTRSL
jgi:excisionase family DNA binding protein